MMDQFNCPILLIAWRRTETLRQVIDAIRPLAPLRIFVACDGPSLERPGEVERVVATRNLIAEEIDWPCEVKHFYSDVNQGCRLGVSRAISWFFEQVDAGIILEDDCVPHPDFFSFCEELLQRYRDDTRVWCISGSNFQDGQWRGDASYYFSRYSHCWGWASWRRCWVHYDGELSHWMPLRDSGLLDSVFQNPLERQYWSNIFQRLLDQGKPDSWAYRWTLTCLFNGGLVALPNVNLVSNVGFGADATHTKGPAISTPIDRDLSPIKHPKFILSNSVADSYTFANHFGGRFQGFPYSWLRRLKKSLAYAYRHLRS